MARAMQQVTVVGGGLAGSEAAWQLAQRGVPVRLYEMRPARPTPAHKTDRLAELVCSNSLKSNAPDSASGLLKEELRRAGSLLIQLADENAVPGGTALRMMTACWRDAGGRAVRSAATMSSTARLR